MDSAGTGNGTVRGAFLLLTGGEPLLFPDFRKLYLELKKLGIILTINTNGTLLDQDWADFFGRYKPRRINITLYGSDDGAYEKLCHYPGGFSKTVQAIRLLRERNVDVKINGSVTKWNRDDMESIYQIGRELNVPVHMDTYMLPGIHERGLPFEQQSRLMPEEAAAAEIDMRKAEMSQEDFREYVKAAVALTEKMILSIPIRYPALPEIAPSLLAGGESCVLVLHLRNHLFLCLNKALGLRGGKYLKKQRT